jgi:hypothetical protein
VTAELELTVIQPAAELGYVAGFAITDELIHVAGGTSSAAPFVLASSNAKRFERMRTPRELGLRGIAVHRGEVWSCGEFGQLARSSDHGATWKLVPTQTDACMFAIAAIGDDLWLAGDRGFCARMRGTAIEPIDLGTRARLAAIYEHDGDVIVVSRDGVLQRWRAGELKGVPTGATTGLTGVAITKRGTWIAIGDRGFITRSPDGAWFSRSSSGTDADLEAVLALPDGRVVIVGDLDRRRPHVASARGSDHRALVDARALRRRRVDRRRRRPDREARARGRRDVGRSTRRVRPARRVDRRGPRRLRRAIAHDDPRGRARRRRRWRRRR